MVLHFRGVYISLKLTCIQAEKCLRKATTPPPFPSPKNTMSPKQRTIIRHGDINHWLSGTNLLFLFRGVGSRILLDLFPRFCNEKRLNFFFFWGGGSTYITQLFKDDFYNKPKNYKDPLIEQPICRPHMFFRFRRLRAQIHEEILIDRGLWWCFF